VNPLSPQLDVAGPGLLAVLGVGIGLAIVLLVVVVLVEAAVLRLVRWATFPRSVLASLLMNIASLVVGLFFISLSFIHPVIWLLLAFALSVAIEGGVLVLMDRPHAGRGLGAALIANVVTYLPLAGLLAWGLSR
jgi:ABC-type nickel/cobalt efflux system permease component RcnA